MVRPGSAPRLAERADLGMLNDDEVLKTIPVHAWDHRVDVIVTPTRMITCEPSVLCNL